MSQMLRLPSLYPKATWNGLFLFILRHLIGLWTAKTVGKSTNAYNAIIPSAYIVLPSKPTSFPLIVICGLGGRCTLGISSSSCWFIKELINSSSFFDDWFFLDLGCLPPIKDVEIFLSYFFYLELFVLFFGRLEFEGGGLGLVVYWNEISHYYFFYWLLFSLEFYLPGF